MDKFTVNVITEGVAGLTALVSFLGVAVFARSDKRQRNALLSLFAVYFAVSLFDLSSCVFLSAESGEGAAIVFKTLSEIARAWALVVIGINIGALARIVNRQKTVWLTPLLCVGVATTILLFINLYEGFLFKIGENGEFESGSLFFLMLVFEGALWLVDLICAIIRKKDLPIQDTVTLISLLFIYLVGYSLEMIFSAPWIFALSCVVGIVVKSFGETAKQSSKIDKEKSEAEKLKKDIIDAKEKLFQSQVSPHFIYNSLTAIRELPDNPPETKKAIGDFAKYLRQTLTTISENELIPFEKELENVKTYLRLEKLRFGDSLKFVYDIKFSDFSIPAMCVQMLAENAVKHGVAVKRGGGTVTISVEKQGEYILISVRDDGVGFNVESAFDTTHVGINNVKNRISSILGGEVVIKSEIGVGTDAAIIFKAAE